MPPAIILWAAWAAWAGAPHAPALAQASDAPAASPAAAQPLVDPPWLAPPMPSGGPLSCGADAPAAEDQAARLGELPELGQAASEPDAPKLREETQLGGDRLVRGRSGGSGTVYVRADQMNGDMDVDTTLRGSVEVRKEGLVLRADSAVYKFEDDEVKARGNVHLYDRGLAFDSQALDMKIEAETGVMPEATYRYAVNNASGQSKLVEFMSQDTVRLNNVVYTTCDPTDPAWWLKMNRMDIHQDLGEAEANGAILYFQSVPVFEWPYYFDFPIGAERRSGFLTPGFSQSSQVGAQFSIPYYWNIAPNRDDTLIVNYLPDRGMKFDDEFRFLEPHWRGVLTYSLLPVDHGWDDLYPWQQGLQVHDKARTFAGAVLNYDNAEGLKANVNASHVSDDTYFTDFSSNIVTAAQEVLPEVASVSYTQTYWNTALSLDKNQTLLALLAATDPGPYERTPDAVFNWDVPDWHGFEMAGTVDATRFTHGPKNPCYEPADATLVASLVAPCFFKIAAVVPPFTQDWFAQDGSRLVVNPAVSYPILAPGWFVVPKAQWHYTDYELEPGFNDGATSATRSMPILSLDSGLIFERPSSFLGQAARQTLEPRLFYAWIPYRSQNTLPDFDSAESDFTFAQLFTENSFTGNDRIAQTNAITLALTTRIIDEETGAERLRLALGQRYYFGSQNVLLPGEIPPTGKASDTLFLASAALDKKWNVDLVLDYDSLTNTLATATFGFRWHPEHAQVLNLSYRYELASLAGEPEATNQPMVSYEWPISRRWYGVGAVDYSISDRRLAQGVSGFEYKGDCWVARIALSRYAITQPNSIELSDKWSQSYFLQIEFNGLSGVGFNPIDVLQVNIPGYQRINAPNGSGGPYDRYE